MKISSRTLLAGTLTASMSLMPAIAGATSVERPDRLGLHALSGPETAGALPFEAMSDDELASVWGGARWRGGARFPILFNIAIVPQFNICIFCSGVNQSNFAFVFGLNRSP